MRTTLEVDDRVLAWARARVHAQANRSLGEAVSELALEALQARDDTEFTADPESGLVFLPSSPGHVITSEMVARALNEE